MSEGVLPTEPQVAAKVVTQATVYTLLNGILYYNGQKDDFPRAVVPCSLQWSMIEEYRSGIMAGHFSGPKVYKAMLRQWWWQSIYQDIINYSRGFAQCAIVIGSGRRQLPPLQSIPVDHPFQIVGLDIMALPLRARGNRYAIVFQDMHVYQVADGLCYP